MTKQELIDKIKNSPHNMIKVAVTDVDGILRGKIMHKQKFFDVLENSFGFCDVIMGWDCTDNLNTNTTLTGWHTGFPDTQAAIDLSTLREMPWQENTPFVLADLKNAEGNAPHSACPRSLLKSIEAKANNLSFDTLYSQEFEWFNFEQNKDKSTNKSNLQTITDGMFGYSLLRLSQNHPFVSDLFTMLESFGVPLEGLHTETGPGVYEAAIQKQPILLAADNAVLLKAAVKEIANKHGFTASFMAKWNQSLPGCSGHIHQSLWDKEGTNLFHNSENPEELTNTLKHFMAGQLYCLPQIMPMYAPTINSYKRLVDGSWAPNTPTWGIENRTTALRFIKGTKPSGTNLEMRVPGSDSNPYLAMAASLASGLYGIENQLPLTTESTLGNAYQHSNKLPNTLQNATNSFRDSKVANSLFGEAFVSHFCKTREWECQQYEKQVSDWELNRYLEII